MNDTSVDRDPGPISVLRPAVPWNPAAGSTYAVLSNHCSGVGFDSTPRSDRATFTRCGTYDPHAHTLVPVTVNGNPVAARKMPCTCQPPRMYAAAPPSCSQRLPSPNGSS